MEAKKVIFYKTDIIARKHIGSTYGTGWWLHAHQRPTTSHLSFWTKPPGCLNILRWHLSFMCLQQLPEMNKWICFLYIFCSKYIVNGKVLLNEWNSSSVPGPNSGSMNKVFHLHRFVWNLLRDLLFQNSFHRRDLLHWFFCFRTESVIFWSWETPRNRPIESNTGFLQLSKVQFSLTSPEEHGSYTTLTSKSSSLYHHHLP